VAHLVYADEANWITRARVILEHGDGRPCEPFDASVQLERYGAWPLDAQLDRLSEVRRANLELVRSWHLTEADLARPGRHPELGPVDLRKLLATWAVHDLNHLAQVARVMAKRYTQEVGAWRAYLSILGR
jgi:hypothetical protein